MSREHEHTQAAERQALAGAPGVRAAGRGPLGLLAAAALLAGALSGCGGGDSHGGVVDAGVEAGFTFAGLDGGADSGGGSPVTDGAGGDVQADDGRDAGGPAGGPDGGPDGGASGCSADAECEAWGDGVCTRGVCAPSGQCAAAPRPDGTPCQGDDPCLEGRMCLSGVCAGGLPVSCDDGDPCTEDDCDAQLGCTHVPAVGCCAPSCAGKECGDDGCGGSCGACSGDASCVAGACVGGCVPSCAGKECGDDGCGGSCGACSGDASCVAGACVGGPDGGSCASPYVVAGVPFTVSRSTAGASNDHHFSDGACPGETYGMGAGSADHVYAFTPAASGTYRVAIDTTFDGVLYAATACDDVDGSCLEASDEHGLYAVEELVRWFDAGQAVYLFVDGYSDTSDNSGTYTLTVEEVQACVPACDGKACGDDGCGGSCGSCAGGDACVAGVCVAQGQGESCAWPFVLAGALPVTASGDTAGASKDFGVNGGSCPGLPYDRGAGSADHVYAFTPPADGDYTLTLDASFDTALYVLADCVDADGSCQGGVDLLGTETLTVYLLADTTYYVIVDGYSAYDDLTGTYTLTVAAHDPGACAPACAGKECGDDGCGGHCGSCLAGGGVCTPAGLCEAPGAGETCASPFTLTGDPATATGDTTGASKDFGVQAGACPGLDYDRGDGSGDHVYAYSPAVSGTYEVSLAPSFDAALYVVTDCSSPGASCLGGSDTLGAESVTVSMEAGTTYYVIVDGYSDYSDYSGAYTLTVQGPGTGGCTPACAGKECGDDGCGGTCGACPSGDACVGGACAAPGTGDTCASPFQVGALPYTAQTTTALGFDDLYGDCSPAFTTGGDGSTDHIYRLVAPSAGTYTVQVDPDGWDAIVYALSACDAAAPSCLAGVDGDGYGGVETLALTLTAGQEVWVVVDGYTISGDEYGPYSISITGP